MVFQWSTEGTSEIHFIEVDVKSSQIYLYSTFQTTGADQSALQNMEYKEGE